MFAPKQVDYRNQFLMSKGVANQRKLHCLNVVATNAYENSIDFMTSNTYYNQLTANSGKVLRETTAEVNPIIDELSPETFEVAAKRHSALWKTKQYTEKEFKAELMATTNRIEQAKLPDHEFTEKMRVKEFNNRCTNVSEYSNALNRGRVFINPKFSSC